MRIVALVLVVIAAPVLCASAQISVQLRQDILTRSDTAWVDVVLNLPADSSGIDPIRAYQFRVLTSPDIRFIGSDEMFTLTDKSGWTSGFNVENGRVGAFGSSADAFLENGVLVRLQFVMSPTDTSLELKLLDFLLNSGNPDHIPAVPSLRLDLTSHDE
jgi:hypothetical protein